MAKLTQRKIFAFWAPLAITWFMMSIEGPYVAGIIARLPEPKYNLAAYGVAFAIALILEAPIIMIMAATTALVRDKLSYSKLFKFTNVLNISITLGILLVLYEPIFNFITISLMGLPRVVANLVYTSVFLLVPWPAAIGFRRFFQGVMIVNGKTKNVAFGTIVRLISMSVSALVLKYTTDMDGAPIGATALSCGVVAEAIAAYIMARKSIVAIKSREPQKISLSYKEISKFYYPLALTSTIGLVVQPVIVFFVGLCFMPIESLAILPVVNSLVFIFRCVGLSYQEVVVAKMGANFEEYVPIRKFITTLGTVTSSLVLLIAFTPLSKLYFVYFSGLTPELAEFASMPLIIMAFITIFTFWITWERAMIVNLKRTHTISIGAAIELITITVVMIFASKVVKANGAIAATTAMVIGKAVSCLYLYFPSRLYKNSKTCEVKT